MSAATTVVGLFRARGQAENARNRLKTEGVAEDRMALKVLKETAPVPPATQLETRARVHELAIAAAVLVHSVKAINTLTA